MPEGPYEITVQDFSEAAIKKAVRGAGLLHPVTLYLPAIGIGAGFIGFLFGASWLYLVAIVGALGGVGNGVLRIFLLKEKAGQKIQRMHRKALAEQARRATEALEEDLMKLRRERAAKQVTSLKDTFLRFRDKLVKQIGKDKREYEQYLGSAEVMYLAALSNLKTVSDNEVDIQLVDVEDSRRRIEELKADTSRDNSAEIESQQRQIRMVEEAEKNTKDLIAEVEGAITALLDVTRSLSEIKATRESLNQNVAQAMNKFQHIAERNKRIYDRVAASWEQLQAKY